MRLLHSGLNVILLEAGGERPDGATQALYTGEVADSALHSPPDRYRQRRFGGSTTIWGGRCVPLDPIDLQTRPWLDHASWPIGYETLMEYYPDANELCEAGSFEYDARLAIPGGMRPVIPGFAPDHFNLNGIEQFSLPTDFGRRYRTRLAAAANLRVLLHANATRLVTTADGSRVEHLEVRTLRNTGFRIRADRYILAAGGIEVPRLLLASRDTHAAGIGNAEGLVGRFYMCHIAGTIGGLRVDLPRDAVWHGYDRTDDGVYCRRRFSVKPEVQRNAGIGNAIFRLHHPRIPDPAHRTGALSAIFLARRLISYEYSKRLAGGSVGPRDWFRHVGNLARDPFATAGFLWHWLNARILAERKFPSVIIHPRANLFSLDFNGEQAPNPDSRITLSRDLDPLGMPKVRVDWRHSPIDIHTIRTAFGLLQEDFARSGLARLSLEPGEEDFEQVVLRDGAYGGHHIGTARMGVSPASGVVDRDCRVFGVANLFVAGSAVFPTSGQANPTLTLVALALRLADHVAQQAGTSGVAVPSRAVGRRVEPVQPD